MFLKNVGRDGRESRNVSNFGRESRNIRKFSRDGRNIPFFVREIRSINRAPQPGIDCPAKNRVLGHNHSLHTNHTHVLTGTSEKHSISNNDATINLGRSKNQQKHPG